MRKKVQRTVVEYIILNLCVLVGLLVLLQLWRSNMWKYPLYYSSDAVTGLASTKVMLEESNIYFWTDKLGAPFVYRGTDFVTPNFVAAGILYFLVKTTKNVVFARNFYYLVDFFLIANVSFVVLKKIKLSDLTAMSGALIFTFAPYHFLRAMYHLSYSSYWMIPIVVYMCYKLMNGERLFTKNHLNNVLWIIGIICIAAVNTYYAFFACILITISIIYNLVNTKKIFVFLRGLIPPAIISLTVIAGYIPIILNKTDESSQVAERNVAQVEVLSLKIAQLFLPITNHRIQFLSEIKKQYNSLTQVNENDFSSLGLMATIGCVVLLVYFFKRNKPLIMEHTITLLVPFLFIAVVGGISSIIGLFFSSIRAYNRTSIFIMFFGIVALGYATDILIQRISNVYIKIILVVLITIAGVWEQTSNTYIPNYEVIKETWDSEENFVSGIEGVEDAGAMIYEMPYYPYPEYTSKYFFGYIHSNDLKWSFGCYKGSIGDEWNEKLDEYGINEKTDELCKMGFSGIVFDSYAYEENELLEMINCLGEPEVQSVDGRWYYFSLKNHETDDTIAQTSIIPIIKNGIYSREEGNDFYFRYCESQGNIMVYNCNSEAIKIKLKAEVIPHTEGQYWIKIQVNGNEEVFDLIGQTEGQIIEQDILLLPGENNISFESNMPNVDPESKEDTRKLAFMIKNYSFIVE